MSAVILGLVPYLLRYVFIHLAFNILKCDGSRICHASFKPVVEPSVDLLHVTSKEDYNSVRKFPRN